MDQLLGNLRYAARRLRQRPGFTIVAALSLGIGIGANTAIFSLVNAVLLRDVPLERPEELVEVYLSTPDFEYGVMSWPDYEDFVRATAEVFSDVAAMRPLFVQIDTEQGVEMFPGEGITGNYFQTLGIPAAIGRALSPDDDVAPGAHPVVMLGHGYWRSAYGGDPGVIGETLRMGGQAYTIVGVAPESYTGHLRGVVPAVFAPRMMSELLQAGSTSELESRGHHSVFVRARLAPGVSLARAQTAADALATRLTEERVEDWDIQASFLFAPTADVVLYPPADKFIYAVAWILSVVVGLVLLMACTNLASFLLARALDRRKEVALRLALGATRRQLVAQLFTETLMLAALGGLAGVAVSMALLQTLLVADLPLPLPITLDLSPDGSVLVFSLLVSIVAGALLGLAPALQSTNPDMSATIKDESAGVGRTGPFTLRNALVVFQVATSLFLLMGAGLFLRSLDRVQDVDPGFGREPAAILSTSISPMRYSDAEGRAFTERLLERFEAIAGVRAVGLTGNLHLNTLSTHNIDFNVDGFEPPEGRESQESDTSVVSAGFFAATGIRIVRGRNFSDQDRPDSPPVAIVSQALAARFFADRDPIGGILRRPDSERGDLRIVGVASDAKVRSLGEAPRDFIYRPYSQNYASFITIVAQTEIDPNRTVVELVAAGRELDPELMIYDAKTMERHLGVVLLPARLWAVVFSAFAVVALVLASVGLYGVVSYQVSQRTREVGIRMSLGADTRRVVGMLMANGLGLVGVGTAVGLAGAFLMAPALSGVLFGVESTDALTFASTPVLLALVAAAAAYFPARRASRIDPVRALRAE